MLVCTVHNENNNYPKHSSFVVIFCHIIISTKVFSSLLLTHFAMPHFGLYCLTLVFHDESTLLCNVYIPVQS